MLIEWSLDKNIKLKKERDLSFEEIANEIKDGNILGIHQHHNRPKQRILVVDIRGYAVAVPFIEKENKFFLKTAYYSRKFNKLYGVDDE